MRRIDLPNDNAGGLRLIAAIPPENFVGIVSRPDGSRELRIRDTGNVIGIPCLPSDAGFQENKRESDNGDLYEIRISGVIYGKSENNDRILSELDSGTWIVAFEDAEGRWMVAGTNRVRLVFERKRETGTARSGLKGSTFTFSCEDEYPCPDIHDPAL